MKWFAMKLTFQSLAILSALVFFSLALIWMFAANVMLSRWGVDFSYSVGLMARRGAALYAGIGVMLFSARNAGPSPARSALVTGFVVACLILATLGVFELATGHAGFGISVAVLIEIALTLASLYVAHASH
jgi:hypothetical protein